MRILMMANYIIFICTTFLRNRIFWSR